MYRTQTQKIDAAICANLRKLLLAELDVLLSRRRLSHARSIQARITKLVAYRSRHVVRDCPRKKVTCRQWLAPSTGAILTEPPAGKNLLPMVKPHDTPKRHTPLVDAPCFLQKLSLVVGQLQQLIVGVFANFWVIRKKFPEARNFNPGIAKHLRSVLFPAVALSCVW